MKRIALAFALSLLASAATAQDAVTVEGKSLHRDGQPFEIHGVQLMSFVAPIDYLENPPAESCNRGLKPPCPLRAYVRAYKNFGPDSLRRAKEFGANTILFKVAEPGLDDRDPMFSQRYVDDIVRGVSLTRAQGFIVILSIQENRVSAKPGPAGTRSPIPDEGTLRAAVKLAKLFGSDRGVMIELYVEPYAGGRLRAYWDYYINGGGGFPGVNAIIRAMRDAGSRNVLIVEPLRANWSHYPGGIVDSFNQLAFGIHTYFQRVGTTRETWDTHFGNFAANHPLIVTEWNQNTAKVGDMASERKNWCETAPMDAPLKMFHYFKEKGINGAIGWAFDLPSTIVDEEGRPRTLKGFRCGERGGGIGELFMQYFSGTLPPISGETGSK